MEDSSQLKKLNFIKRKDWLILAAVILLCAALAVWGFLGVIQTTATVSGISFCPDDDNTYVAVPIDSNIAGDIETENTKSKIIPEWVTNDGSTYLSGTVCYISPQPMNSSEIDELTGGAVSGDFFTDEDSRTYVAVICLDKEDGVYTFNNGDVLSDIPDSTICDVIIIISESSPYEIITGGGQQAHD